MYKYKACMLLQNINKKDLIFTCFITSLLVIKLVKLMNQTFNNFIPVIFKSPSFTKKLST